MAKFEPTSTIYLCQTGIDAHNKPYFESNTTMGMWVISKAVLTFTQYSYQRGDERQYCSVEAPYDECIKCDTIAFNNDATFWTIGNITGCEFKNPNCTWVYFEIDAFCTFCGDIDWPSSYSMVEREHIAQDWNGNIPNWNELGVAEPIQAEAKSIFGTVMEPYMGASTLVLLSPYGNNGNPNIGGQKNHGLFDSLKQISSTSAEAINNFLMIALMPDTPLSATDIIGIYSVPSHVLELDGTAENYGQIQTPWAQNTYILDNAKCYCGQYFVMKIESMVGTSMSYSPELLPATASITIMLNGVFTGGSGGISCYPQLYAGTDGQKFAAMINGFPQSAWVSDSYGEWLAASSVSQSVRLTTGLLGAMAVAPVNPVGAALDATSTIGGLVGEHQMRQKGAAVVQGQVASSSDVYAMATDNYNFKIAFYGPTYNELKSIDAFFSMFGYKVMRLKVPERNTRPCWNYVKCIDAHVHCKAPLLYVRKIEQMMNEGVTFWNVGARSIGDYSNPSANKA